jgi:hypothetical protein
MNATKAQLLKIGLIVGVLAAASTFVFVIQRKAPAEEGKELSFEKEVARLVAQSQVIAIGRVLSVETAQQEGIIKIWTHVTLSVEKYVKGDLHTPEVTIKYPGGRRGKVIMMAPSTPFFRPGEDVLVFLWEASGGYYSVNRERKFTVLTDDLSGKKKLVGNPLLGSEELSLDGIMSEIDHCMP